MLSSASTANSVSIDLRPASPSSAQVSLIAASAVNTFTTVTFTALVGSAVVGPTVVVVVVVVVTTVAGLRLASSVTGRVPDKRHTEILDAYAKLPQASVATQSVAHRFHVTFSLLKTGLALCTNSALATTNV